jgi:hypothetical protein
VPRNHEKGRGQTTFEPENSRLQVLSIIAQAACTVATDRINFVYFINYYITLHSSLNANEELTDLHSSLNAIRVIQSRIVIGVACSTYGGKENCKRGFGGET